MYPAFKSIHSLLAYILLLGILLPALYALINFYKKAAYTPMAKTMALIGLITAHLQLLLGLVLYFISPVGLHNFSGGAMKNSITRLYVLEHPLTMLVAIVLITVGYSRAKRQTIDYKKYKTILTCYSIGLFLILIRLPWHAWPG